MFWNRGEHRLRLVWRLLIQFLAMGILLIIMQVAGVLIGIIAAGAPPAGVASSRAGGSSPLTELFSTLFSGLAITASVFFTARFIDRRDLTDLGLKISRSWWLDFGFGFILGAILMLLIFVTELSLGWIEVQGVFSSQKYALPSIYSLLAALFSFIIIGFYEELLSRGYQIKNIAESLSGRLFSSRTAILVACGLTSITFGLLHAANPNASMLSMLNITLAGIFLSAGYLITGQLAIPIGLHISWNFFQGPIFGFPVSGWSSFSGIVFQIEESGPELWTGAKFGPEGGLIATLATLIGLVSIFLYKNRRGLYLPISHFSSRNTASDPLVINQSRNYPGSPQPIRHIIWDWNGTLLNDLDLCLKIINEMLKSRDLPAITRECYLELFDFPVKEYYERIGFDFSREPFEAISTQFIKSYEAGRPDCDLMEGVPEILATIQRKGISQSILSASKGSYLVKAISDYGIAEIFDSVQGLDNHHASGKLDLAREFIRNYQLLPADFLLVGDTTHDAAIASSLGFHCVLIPNGHHSRTRLVEAGFPILDSLKDIEKLIL